MSLFNVYPLFDINPIHANDVYLYDEHQIKYLDLYGGHAVISIGHSHPTYVKNLQQQLEQLGFYSNSVKNTLQETLAHKLCTMSDCSQYQLFLCNSGAEANENALKLASFHTQKSKVIAFKNGFHGRTSAAVAVTDNLKIKAPINTHHPVEFIDLGDLETVEKIASQGEVCAIIIEIIQGVGGLGEASTTFYQELSQLCQQYDILLIVDEIQSGFGRTGDFFAFQKHQIKPDIITMAKGMGNGFPMGGLLIHPKIKASLGMLGTTFGGNHLACTASLSVLEVLEKDKLLVHTQEIAKYFRKQLAAIIAIKQLKGRGLMLGLEFDFPITALRKELLYKHHIFTGNSKDPNLLRILPPLTLQKQHIDIFIQALQLELSTL
ncbi:aspartate aminotransferase family protein [Aquimarina rhabdastrellae]